MATAIKVDEDAKAQLEELQAEIRLRTGEKITQQELMTRLIDDATNRERTSSIPSGSPPYRSLRPKKWRCERDGSVRASRRMKRTSTISCTDDRARRYGDSVCRSRYGYKET